MYWCVCVCVCYIRLKCHYSLISTMFEGNWVTCLQTEHLWPKENIQFLLATAASLGIHQLMTKSHINREAFHCKPKSIKFANNTCAHQCSGLHCSAGGEKRARAQHLHKHSSLRFGLVRLCAHTYHPTALARYVWLANALHTTQHHTTMTHGMP